MQMIGFILLAVSSAFYFSVNCIYFTHMLQLNSYKNERFYRWWNENGRPATPRHNRLWQVASYLIMAIFIVIQVFAYQWTIYILAGFIFAAAIISFPKKAKKPLAVTWRVKRLFVTEFIILLCVLLFVYYLMNGILNDIVWYGVKYFSLLILLVFLAIPVCWVYIANLINAPIEKLLANRYIRDAKKRLAAVPDLIVIGITGSYGKTSVKNFLHALLSVKYNTLMTPESYNTTLGVVRTIREQLRPSHQVFIAEMGAKQIGDIKEICDIVHPRYGILTSIGPMHLETFGSIDNVIKTKFELVDALPPDGTAFLNSDNAYIRERQVNNVPAVRYGLEDGDYTVSDITVDRSGSSFTVTAPGGETQRFTTKLLGSHTIQNLLGCVAVAHTLGIPLADLTYPLRLLKPVPHRLQLLPSGYIDDAYNSNPTGFKAALEVLRAFDGLRVLVTPGMVELGAEQEALNTEAGRQAAGFCDIAVLVGERQAPPLKAGLLEAGFPEDKIFVAKNLNEGLAYVNKLPGNKTVLLENDLPDNF